MAEPLGFRDFNPAARDASRFGYSPVRDALHNVYKFLGLVAPLTYPRALDTNHWTAENIQDWPEVAKTIVLQYNKSTEGTWFTDIDSQLATLEGKAAGLISLFYAFFRRNIDGKAQFNYFKQKTEPLILQIGGKKIVIIDMETKDGVDNLTGNGNFKGFSNEAHAAGYLVGLYVNPSDWVEFGLGSWVNVYVDFYILAHWKPGNNPDKPAGIDVSKIAIQQEGVYDAHSWIEPIPGLVPQMDANLLLWPLAQWETFTGQKYTPGATEPPPPDPIGELQMEFINTGGDISNIRYAPVVNTTNIIGKLPDGAKFTALEIDFTAGYAWAKYAVDPAWLLPGKTGATGWSALVAISGNPLIDFHAAVPCPEGEPIPMTPEQLTRLENAEALLSQHELEIIVLQNTIPGTLKMTHKVSTTNPNGEKLRNNPDSGEHTMLANGVEVRLLNAKAWKGMKLYGLYVGGMPVWGYLADNEVIPL